MGASMTAVDLGTARAKAVGALDTFRPRLGFRTCGWRPPLGVGAHRRAVELDKSARTSTSDAEATRHRLASEIAQVEGAIQLVASGEASRVSLSGLKFGEQLSRRFGAEAQAAGVHLEPLPWPDDAGCDLLVRRIDE